MNGKTFNYYRIYTRPTGYSQYVLQGNYDYHHGNPKFWEQGWWNYDQSDLGEKIANWTRFCIDFAVMDIYEDIPTCKFIGCRSDSIQFPNGLLDHRFGMRTNNGEYFAVGSNYNTNHEVDNMKREIQLGAYKDKTYEASCLVLPKEYSFHNLVLDCQTVLWKCHGKKIEKSSKNAPTFTPDNRK